MFDGDVAKRCSDETAGVEARESVFQIGFERHALIRQIQDLLPIAADVLRVFADVEGAGARVVNRAAFNRVGRVIILGINEFWSHDGVAARQIRSGQADHEPRIQIRNAEAAFEIDQYRPAVAWEQTAAFGIDFLQNPAGDGAAEYRNGISFWQALVVGIGQALAVIPGLSRSGTTISTGLICGVKRQNMAQFSFLMVLVPILGEAFLDIVGGDFSSSSVGVGPLLAGFAAAFVSGLFACKVMIALVRKAQLKWFGLYCVLAGLAVLIFLA